METKKVRLAVLSSQVTDSGESEPAVLTTFGELTALENHVYDLRYTEYLTDGEMGRIEISTFFRITKDSVSIERGMGDHTYQMVFEKGKQHHSIYNTPYGELEVTVQPLQLWSELTPDGGILELYYSLQMEHRLVGYHSLRLEITPCGAQRAPAEEEDS